MAFKKLFKVPKKELSLEEVLELLDFFMSGVGKSTKEEVLSHVEDYLHRGERLETLAKERFKDALKKLEISDFEELLYSVDPKGDYLVDALGKKVVRPILKAVPIKELENGDKVLDESYEPYAQLLKYLKDFNFTIEVDDSSCYGRRFRKQLQQGDSMLWLYYYEPNLSIDIYGTKNHTHSRNNMNIIFQSGTCVADIAIFLSWLLICQVFINTLTDTMNAANMDFLSDYISSGRANYNISISKDELIGSLSLSRELDYPWWENLSDEQIAEVRDPFKHKHWIIPKSSSEAFEIVKPLLVEYDIEFEEVDADYDDIKDSVWYDVGACAYNNHIMDVPVVVNEDIVKTMFIYNPIVFMQKIPNAFKYSLALENRGRKSGKPWAIPQHWGTVARIFATAFEVQHKKKHETLIMLKSYKTSASEYAKSFQTKKNINKSTLKAMQESPLNEYFGYVEFDNTVDLKGVEQITEEFIAFKHTYLPGIDSSANAIRFRLLGNHKALGLYYPYVKCLCVDVGSPSSLVHEYGHLIDYCYGNLSAKGEFYQVKEAYRQAINTAMYNDTEFKKRMISKSKYNLDYFLNPTEIFARSFEAYVSKVLKMENSLTPKCTGFEYPETEKYMTAVTEYFEAVLPILNSQDDDEPLVSSKVAATPL